MYNKISKKIVNISKYIVIDSYTNIVYYSEDSI